MQFFKKHGATYYGFVWHALWLAITVTFTEINTVLPAMVIQIGGTELHIGILTAIMVGAPLLSRLLFSGFLHPKPKKKPFLLAGLYIRVAALAAITVIFRKIDFFSLSSGLFLIFTSMLLFTTSGAFASIAYTDIMGKGISQPERRRFFVLKQFTASIGVLVSALIARLIFKLYTYPITYLVLFSAAAAGLVAGSAGFWIIREPPAEKTGSAEKERFIQILKQVPAVLKRERNLRHYIILSNLMGFSLTIAPFYILLAKRSYGLDAAIVGNLLLVQIAGMVVSNLIWNRLVKSGGIKIILIAWIVLSIAIPPAALIISRFFPFPVFLILFFFAGAAQGAYKIAQDGVIVEISTNENRVLVTGIHGTLNLSVAVFPLIAGGLIKIAGFLPVFILVSVLAGISLYFASVLECPIDKERKQKITQEE